MRGLSVAALALVASACSVPSARDNFSATAEIVRAKAGAGLEWRRDPAADAEARERAAALLADGVTLDEAVAIAFLTSPALQISVEQLAISRAELLAAVTPPNPTAIVGSRKVGGNLSAFYPDRSISVGVLQSLLSLLSMPDRVGIARRDLERARAETAQQAVTHAAQVVEAWIEHSAAVQIHALAQQGIEGVDPVRAELDEATTRARLGELMGVSGWRDDWQVVGTLPSPPATDPEGAAVEDLAMQQRLDLQAATRAVDVRLKTLAMRRRFRWLNQLDIGLFRDKAIGGTAFTGPSVVVEIPLFDQRLAQLLQADSELQIALRRLEVLRLAARTEIRVHAAELRAIRRQLSPLQGEAAPADPLYVEVLREYWRARSALAAAAGDWNGLSGL